VQAQRSPPIRYPGLSQDCCGGTCHIPQTRLLCGARACLMVASFADVTTSGDALRYHLAGNSMNRRTLLCAWAWVLFLLDDQFPDPQTSDFEFLDIEALDPTPLYSQGSDR